MVSQGHSGWFSTPKLGLSRNYSRAHFGPRFENHKSEDNLMEWNAVIFGPTDTPFEDGTFKLTIKLETRNVSETRPVHGPWIPY